MRRTWLWKIALALIIASGLSWLFIKTLRDTIAEPYVVERRALSGWTLMLNDGQEPGASDLALVALQPPDRLVPGVFRQVFQRTMQSLSSPAVPSMPVVLRREYEVDLRTVLASGEVMETVRRAGLEAETFEPVCLAVKEETDGGRSRQLFFLVFDSPRFREVREDLARASDQRGGSEGFDPAAVVPVLPVAATDRDFSRWWPLEVDTSTDCRAPIAISD